MAEGVTLSGAEASAGLCADDTLENPGGCTPGAEGAKPVWANLSGKRTEAMAFLQYASLYALNGESFASADSFFKF